MAYLGIKRAFHFYFILLSSFAFLLLLLLKQFQIFFSVLLVGFCYETKVKGKYTAWEFELYRRPQQRYCPFLTDWFLFHS